MSATAGGGQEIVFNKEPHGPTYDMVMSDKNAGGQEQQDPHWMGMLLPSAIPRGEERVGDFWDGASLLRGGEG